MSGTAGDPRPDRRDQTGAGQRAPKLLTTTQASRRINLTIAVGFAIMIGMVLISKAVIMWIAVLVMWIVLWTVFWLIWGRHWHPIKQFRYEWGGYRQGTFERAKQSEPAFREAWEQSEGAPPRKPPAGGDTPQ